MNPSRRDPGDGRAEADGANRLRMALLLPSLAGGGAERIALALASAWIEAGYDVDLVVARAEGALLALLPDQVRLVDLRAPRIRDTLIPLAAYLRRSRPVAIQASMWPLTVVAIVARMISRVPTRLVVSDHSTLSREYAHLRGWRRFLLRRSLAWAYPRADARIAVSSRSADDLALLSGLPRDRIDVIGSPVPKPPSDTSRAEPESSAGEARILTVGRLSSEKNHALLIRAFAILNRARKSLLTIAGDGVLRGELERIAADEGVADRVTFTGFVIDPWPWYRRADLFVLSSDFEGYPLVLLEAALCGLPIVSTDCMTGPREILKDGEFGRLVPCGDAEALASAMAEMIDNPPDRDRIRAHGQAISGAGASRRYLELMLGRDVG